MVVRETVAMLVDSSTQNSMSKRITGCIYLRYSGKVDILNVQRPIRVGRDSGQTVLLDDFDHLAVLTAVAYALSVQIFDNFHRFSSFLLYFGL